MRDDRGSLDELGRLFSRRSADGWEALLEGVGTVRSSVVWGDDSPDDFRYHVVTVFR